MDEEPRPVTEAPAVPPRLGKGSASDAGIEELLEPFSVDQTEE